MTEGTEAITAVHLVWMVLLAVLAVIVIVVGMHKKSRRVEARREVEVHAEEAGLPIGPPPAGDPASATPIKPATPPTHDRTDPDVAPVANGTEPHPLADEPIAAAIVPDGTAATIALDADAPDDRQTSADGSVTQLKGLGPKVAARLAELGVERVGHLAALDEAQAQALDSELGPFAGRMARDRWIEQARLLASGDREGFERMFGKL